MSKRFYNSVLCVLVLSVSLWAQRGGGGGGHGGAMGGGHGFSGGGHGFAGHPGGMGGPRGAGWNGGGWHGNGWNNGWHGGGWRGNGLRGPYWGAGWRGRYPYWGWGYVGWPSYGYGYGGYAGGYGYGYGYDDYPSDYVPSDYAAANYQAANYQAGYPAYYGPPPPDYNGPSTSYATRDEVLQIQSEVNRLKAQQKTRYAEPPPQTASNEPSTVLVFRDGRTESVHNYAIAGNTLWILDQSHARRVPLANIDVPATKRENEDRGRNFAVPSTQ